jgi:chromosome segregation ATPase
MAQQDMLTTLQSLFTDVDGLSDNIRKTIPKLDEEIATTATHIEELNSKLHELRRSKAKLVDLAEKLDVDVPASKEDDHQKPEPVEEPAVDTKPVDKKPKKSPTKKAKPVEETADPVEDKKEQPSEPFDTADDSDDSEVPTDNDFDPEDIGFLD